MSKERLEEYTHIAVKKDEYKKLKEQAEQVQELEKDIKEWEIVNECWEEINENLAEQNKRYREAIEGIENAWKLTNDYQEYMNAIHDIIKDLEESE